MRTVKEFGAVGDGAADDTAAIEHAVRETEGVLYFPKGTYRLRKPITVSLNRTGFSGMTGEQGTARILMETAGPAFRFVGTHEGTASPPTVKPPVWNDERFPTISHLEILGDHPEADGIELVKTMQATIQNVLIRQCRHAIHLVERNRNFLLANSHLYDCHATGVFFDRCNLHQAIITGNHISYCKQAGIRQNDGDVHNIQITGNDIEYNSGLGEISAEILLEAPTEQVSEFTISSNTIQATRPSPGANIWIRGSKERSKLLCKLITISGNVIGSRQHSIIIEDAARLSITGNTIYDGIQRNVILKQCQNFVLSSNSIGTRPVRWDSTATDGVTFENCEHGVVNGNTFNDCRAGEEENGAGLLLQQCRGVNITGNQMDSKNSPGISLIGSNACLVESNLISLGDQNQSMGLMIDNASSSCQIGNNLVW